MTTSTKPSSFESEKAKYAGAFYVVEVAKGKAGLLKISDITGPNENEKLKVAFHMIKNPKYALANEDGQIISELKLAKGDMVSVLKIAKQENEAKDAIISDLEKRLAEYEKTQGASAAEEQLPTAEAGEIIPEEEIEGPTTGKRGSKK